jgi:hypothetical protein
MTGCVSNKWLDVFRLLHSVWAVVIRVFLILLVRVSQSLFWFLQFVSISSFSCFVQRMDSKGDWTSKWMCVEISSSRNPWARKALIHTIPFMLKDSSAYSTAGSLNPRHPRLAFTLKQPAGSLASGAARPPMTSSSTRTTWRDAAASEGTALLAAGGCGKQRHSTAGGRCGGDSSLPISHSIRRRTVGGSVALGLVWIGEWWCVFGSIPPMARVWHMRGLNFIGGKICVWLWRVLSRPTPDRRQSARKSSNASIGREHSRLVSLASKKIERRRWRVPGGDALRPLGGGCSLAFSGWMVCGVGSYLSFSCPAASPSPDGRRQRLPALLWTDTGAFLPCPRFSSSSVLLLLLPNSQSNPF